MRQLKVNKSITARDSQVVNTYLRDIAHYEMLSVEDEVNLAQRIHNGDITARDEMVNANLRFVVTVAKQYPTTQSLGLMDLINEGNMGLIKAAERFDETRGFKFISYAVHWIRQSIMQAIAEQGRMVRIPQNKLGEQHKIFQFITEFEQQNERRPTYDEVSDALDLPLDRVKEVMGISLTHASIDSPLKEGDDLTMLDVVPDNSFGPADATMEVESLQKELDRVLTHLTAQEQRIIRYFYGIGERALSLDEISSRVGLSRERCRQIREKATRKLRCFTPAQSLRSFMG